MIGAVKGLEEIRVVDPLRLVVREWRSGARIRRDRSRRLRCPRLDLGFFRSRGRETTVMSGTSDLADGECEAFSHDRGSWNDDHLIRWESCTHTPYVARHCRRKLVGRLPWGIPTVVVYR